MNDSLANQPSNNWGLLTTGKRPNLILMNIGCVERQKYVTHTRIQLIQLTDLAAVRLIPARRTAGLTPCRSGHEKGTVGHAPGGPEVVPRFICIHI